MAAGCRVLADVVVWQSERRAGVAAAFGLHPECPPSVACKCVMCVHPACTEKAKPPPPLPLPPRWTTAPSACWCPSTACWCPSTSSPSRTHPTTRWEGGAPSQPGGPAASGQQGAGSLACLPHVCACQPCAAWPPHHHHTHPCPPPPGRRARLHPPQLQLRRLLRALRQVPPLHLHQGAVLPLGRHAPRSQGGEDPGARHAHQLRKAAH